MKAVIVAAGASRRLYPLTLNTPKPLLKIGDLTIIEHSIENLRRNGITDIAVVVGYLKEHFYKILNDKVKFIENPDYASTNDMASLGCAKNFVKDEEFIYLHADLFYHPGILKRCLTRKEDTVLVVDKKDCDEEDMKVRVENNLFVESSKEIPSDQTYGEWIGMARFSKKGAKLLFTEINKILAEGKLQAYDTCAFTRLAKENHRIEICHTEGLFWIEIDFIEEWETAKRLIKESNK